MKKQNKKSDTEKPNKLITIEKLEELACLPYFIFSATQGVGVYPLFGGFLEGGKLKSKKILPSVCRFTHFANDGVFLKKRFLKKLKYIDLDWCVPYEKRRKYRVPENTDDALFFEINPIDVEDLLSDLFHGFNQKYFDGKIYFFWYGARCFAYIWFD